MRFSLIILGALSTLSLAFPLKVCVGGVGLGLGGCGNGHAKVHEPHHVTTVPTGDGSKTHKGDGHANEHNCDGLLSCNSLVGKSGQA